MKNICCLLILITSFILPACNKNHDDDELFNKTEWGEHVDMSSDIIIFIPDIQIYTDDEDKTRYLDAIIDKIIVLYDNGVKIKTVVQAGDITNRNTIREWETADRLFSRLDNKIPYIMCTGNHDYGSYSGDSGNANNRNTPYSYYFDYSSNPIFVASSETGIYDNSFFRIFIHQQPFNIFSLEFAPADDVITWADSIAKKNEDGIGMILTHAYLYKDEERFDFSTHGTSQGGSPYNYSISSFEKVNDGEEIWQKLVYPNASFRFVLCGHMPFPDYVGNLISTNANNNNVLQLLFDTQSFPNGGDGWIQILEFKSDMKTVNIFTYSTVSDFWIPGNTQEFQFMYN